MGVCLRPLRVILCDASTWPRLGSRGWAPIHEQMKNGRGCFNVASARKPRMEVRRGQRGPHRRLLQRGLGSEAEDGAQEYSSPLESNELQRGLGSEAEDGRQDRREPP